ncbi:tetratricopeptide repeat protein [Salinactinospora qingdaonensis]
MWRSLMRASGLSGATARHGAEVGAREPVAGGTPAGRAAWLEQTLREYVETLGPEHARSIAARNNLASKYAETGRRKAAIEQFELALADSLSALGEEHPQTDVIRENLAWCYDDTGRFEDAAVQWEALLQQRQWRLGATAADTVTARARLAAAYRRTGLFDAAIAHYERAIEDFTGLPPEQLEHLRIGSALAYRSAGRLDDAIQQFRMVLAQRQRRLGSRHHETLVIHHQLGRLYLRSGHTNEAVETLARAYRTCLSAAGDHDVRVLTLKVRRDLAGAYRAAGRHREAAALH